MTETYAEAIPDNIIINEPWDCVIQFIMLQILYEKQQYFFKTEHT